MHTTPHAGALHGPLHGRTSAPLLRGHEDRPQAEDHLRGSPSRLSLLSQHRHPLQQCVRARRLLMQGAGFHPQGGQGRGRTQRLVDQKLRVLRMDANAQALLHERISKYTSQNHNKQQHLDLVAANARLAALWKPKLLQEHREQWFTEQTQRMKSAQRPELLKAELQAARETAREREALRWRAAELGKVVAVASRVAHLREVLLRRRKQRQREASLYTACVLVQRHWRGYSVRKQFRSLRKATGVLQRLFRHNVWPRCHVRRRRGAALTLRFLGDLERSNRFTLAMKDVRIKVLQAREAATALQLARFAQLSAVAAQLMAGERKALAEQESRRWQYNKRGLVAGGTMSRSQALPPDQLQPAAAATKPGAAPGPSKGAGEGRAGKGQPAAAASQAGAGGMLPGGPAGTGRLGSTAGRPSPADAAAGKQGAVATGTGRLGAPLPAESSSPGATLHREFKPAKPQPKEKDVTPLAKALEMSSKDFAALEPDADDAVVLEDGRRAPRAVRTLVARAFLKLKRRAFVTLLARYWRLKTQAMCELRRQHELQLAKKIVNEGYEVPRQHQLPGKPRFRPMISPAEMQALLQHMVFETGITRLQKTKRRKR
eukprot:jgi/Astpho2/1682/fgenesh1_pg.00032_%23_26_t